MEIAILALGCFWGPEEKFSRVEGVLNTEVGYCGGDSNPTTYEEVCTGSTNHAEVVKIEFDEKIITYDNLLKKFFEMHDPTTLNRQGPDIGTQYRSEIFFTNDNQKIIRPLNYSKESPGRGFNFFNCKSKKILVVQVLGRVFMKKKL